MTSAAKTVPVPAKPKLNTPRTLVARLYVIWGLDALLLMTAILGAQVHRDAMKGVGRDTAPSIIHAQEIKTAMADMDANVANELLGDPGKMPEAVNTYERRRKDVATALIGAARTISNQEDQEPIEAIQVGLGTYEGRVQHARDLHDRGDKGFVNAYREAAKVMDYQLLPEADRLDNIKLKELQGIYESMSNRSVASVFLLLAAGVALLGVLIVVQKFLTERTHRILNPMLLAATFLTLAFVFYTFVTLGSERHRLKVAKQDAFDSISVLLRAQAVGYAANADHSRYLLDTAHAPDYEAAFFAKADLLVKQSGSDIKGYLADELKNITFEGEEAAARATLADFREYLNIDKEIRQLQQAGKRAEALELCIGKSNAAFDQFDKALGRTVDINQQAFNAAVEGGFEALSYFELKASLIAIAIALLAFFGLLKRIQEYS
jgi:hypothetical protein